jgi:hypothetical protein
LYVGTIDAAFSAKGPIFNDWIKPEMIAAHP